MYRFIIDGLYSRIRLSDFPYGEIPFVDSKSHWKKLIKAQRVYVDRQLADTGTWLNDGSLLEIIDEELLSGTPYKMDLDIIYEDEEVFIVNKPGGIVVSGNKHRTLENAILHYFSDHKFSFRPRFIHRLDNQTSGIIMGARTKSSLLNLQNQLLQHSIRKEYLAIVHGNVPVEMKISLPIDEKDASTETKKLKVIKSNKYSEMSLVQVTIKEGRTHQIRIHLNSLGHPVIGDKLYNQELTRQVKGLYLHAWRVQFTHPTKEKVISVKTPIPKRFKKFGVSQNDLPQF